MNVKLRLGLVLTLGEFLDSNKSKIEYETIHDKIEELGISVIRFDEPLINSAISKKASEYFSRNNVDILLVIAGTWTHDNFIVDIMEYLNCPVIFWSPPDPLGTSFPKIGSLVGTIQNCGVLVKMGKKVKNIFSSINGTRGFSQLKDYLNVSYAIKKLKFSRIGFIGNRTPGMLDTAYHELELRNQIGPETVYIDLSEFLKELNAVSSKEAEDFAMTEINQAQLKDVDSQTILESVQIYLAMKKIVKRNDLDAVAFKCWPDLKAHNICSPCYTLSRLTDEGIMSACEGDVTSAVSMQILFLITGHYIYLGDMLTIDSDSKIAQYFHCGAKSKYLAENPDTIEYRMHADAENVWKPGMTVEFPVKPGRITFARVHEIKSNYRMVVYTGEALKTNMFVRGNPMKVLLDKDPENIVNGLIQSGSPHHQIAVHGDVKDQIRLFCEFLDLDLIEL